MNALEDLFDAIVCPTDGNHEADTHGLVRNLVQRVANWPVTSGHWSLRRTSGLAAVAVLHAQEVLQLVPEQQRASNETALELAELVFGGECKPLPEVWAYAASATADRAASDVALSAGVADRVDRAVAYAGRTDLSAVDRPHVVGYVATLASVAACDSVAAAVASAWAAAAAYANADADADVAVAKLWINKADTFAVRAVVSAEAAAKAAKFSMSCDVVLPSFESVRVAIGIEVG